MDPAISVKGVKIFLPNRVKTKLFHTGGDGFELVPLRRDQIPQNKPRHLCVDDITFSANRHGSCIITIQNRQGAKSVQL